MPRRFRESKEDIEPGMPGDNESRSIMDKLRQMTPDMQDIRDVMPKIVPKIDMYKKAALEQLSEMGTSFNKGLEQFEKEYNAMTPEQKTEQALGMATGTTSGIGKMGAALKTQLPKVGNLMKATGDDFMKALAQAEKSNPRIAEFLTKYAPEEYKQMQMFLHPDKMSGYALKPGGELVNVFSGVKGRGDELIKDAIKRGAQKLDAFEGYLTKDLYPKHGFKEIGRSPNWTPGGPDVVYMAKPQGFRARLAPETQGIMPNTLTPDNPIIQGLQQKAGQANQMDSARFQQIIRSLLKKY